jgi:cytochrome c-type biogenesis protein CcmI
VILVAATAVLVLALPFLLWPLLRPPELRATAESSARSPDELLHQLEEVELDLASGRLDRREADRRLAELRSDAR